jgi:hypothetical protein
MNEIKKIEAQIIEIAKMLEQAEALLLAEPNNFSYQINIDTIKSQISELEKQLQHEKAKRDKEVIEIRLIGKSANGTLPLEVLAKLADGFSGTILNASLFIQFGKKKNKEKIKEVHDIVDLRLAGIATGSTRLFITAKNAPDLFGRSLSEESLNHSFNLLQSQSPEELTQSASKIGKDGVKKLYKFITTISNADLEVDLNWTSPTNDKFEWKGNKETLLKVAQSLNNLQISDPEIVLFSGELIGISMRRTFEIKTDDKKTIKGSYPNELIKEAKTLTIGAHYRGVLEKKTIINSATESERVFYTLISITHDKKKLLS